MVTFVAMSFGVLLLLNGRRLFYPEPLPGGVDTALWISANASPTAYGDRHAMAEMLALQVLARAQARIGAATQQTHFDAAI